jgi:hypothetical protein
VNSAALYDALNLASNAVLFAEGGDTDRSQVTLFEASVAADRAFPEGTPEALALGIILAAAGRVTEMTG